MGKGSKSKAARRKSRAMRKEFELGGQPIRRQPNGQPYRPPATYKDTPTAESTLRRAQLLNGQDGEVDNWIDIARHAGRLTEDQTIALLKYQRLMRGHLSTIGAPKPPGDIIGALTPTPSRGIYDADAELARSRAYLSAREAVDRASRTDSVALHTYINITATPTPRLMAGIARSAEVLARHFG